MKGLAREDPAFRVEAFARVLAYFERRGDSRQIERWSAWLKRAVESLGEAISSFATVAEAGQARPSSLGEGEKALIAEATRLDPSLRKSWLLEGDLAVVFAQDRPPVRIAAHLLALAIDPEEAARQGDDEDAIADRYGNLLRALIPADQAPLVRTYFTTETLPPAYQ